MIYYKLFNKFPVLTTEMPKLDINPNKPQSKNRSAGGAIFFPKDLGIKPSITAETYKSLFKEIDKNILEDLEDYSIYLVEKAVNKDEIEEIIDSILKERD